jgi:hypothetical protein
MKAATSSSVITWSRVGEIEGPVRRVVTNPEYLDIRGLVREGPGMANNISLGRTYVETAFPTTSSVSVLVGFHLSRAKADALAGSREAGERAWKMRLEFGRRA